MSSDELTLWLLWLSAPVTTVYVLLYALALPWWRSWTGWAIITPAFGLAALVDISLAKRLLGADYQARDYFRVGVFSLITLGMLMQLLVLIQVLVRKRRGELP